MNPADRALANPGLLGRVLDWLRARCSDADELAGWSRDDLRNLADDLALSEYDLAALSGAIADNNVLMERMMRARGFEPELLRNSFAALVRDMERVCSRCKSTGRCRRELDAGCGPRHAHEYCPNAGTFDDLVEYATSI
ncbi:MAG TPA: DUF6455 family protein [Acetobacteraceae bacterium]|jgi:hypothetical protein|nr:DUF6455 family protein [Acetobacteraceae bacterium]